MNPAPENDLIASTEDSALPVTDAANAPSKRILLSVEAVVVGSGTGGAAIAYELARAGHSVALLEAGSYIQSSRFNENHMDMMGMLYRHHGMESNKQGDLTLMQGACLGGSSVSSACISQRLPDAVLNRWARELGLEKINAYAMQPWFRYAEQLGAVHVNAQHEINGNASKIIAGAEKIGFNWKPVSRNVYQCASIGHCLSGCASDRKRSALVTYIPWAIEHRAKVFADAHVDNVLIEQGRAAGVDGRIVDPVTGREKTRLKVSAQVVILATGAIQTPVLMQRAGLLNPLIGGNLSMQPQISVVGEFDEPVHGWRGALAGVYLPDFVGGASSRFLYSAMPAPVTLNMQGSHASPDEAIQFMKRAANMAVLQCMVQDQGQGRVYLKNGQTQVDWRPTRSDFESMKQGVKTAGDILFAAGAKKVFLPTTKPLAADDPFHLDDLLRYEVKWGAPNGIPNGRHVFRMYSTSPQGTARMGVNPASSVVNEYGRCHELSGLFVSDASLFPEGTQVPPQLGVAALATYIADHIKENAGDYFT